VGDRIELVAVAISVVLLVVVIELVRRRKLTEEYSLLWILSSLAMLGLSLRREILHAVARWLGIYYPPMVLLLLLVLIVFVATLSFSVVVSRQRQQIERLIEESAVLSAELRNLRQSASLGPGAEPPGTVVADPARDRS
jgi:hypothetical protein